jgi:uncharacterized protein (TIGR03067 family)
MSSATSAATDTQTALVNGLQELQGAWLSIAGRRKGNFLITGNRFTFEFQSGEIYKGTLSVDATPDPRHMDMQIEEGPEKHKGKLTRCIYQLEDEDTMHWCPAAPGVAERLSWFPTVRDERYLSMVFRRFRLRSS